MNSAAQLRPIDRETLWDRAYAELKSALLAGRFAPGERIVLRDVAEAMQISLTPVRDAVNRLVAERALERGSGGQGGSALVPRVSVEHFEQLLMIRSALEPRAAAAACARVDDADIDAIEKTLDTLHRRSGHPRLERYLDEHRRFHFDIYRRADLPVIYDVIENTWLRCGPVLTLLLPEYVPSIKRNEFHATVLAALRRRDAQAAADAVRGDIEAAGDYLLQRLKVVEQAANGVARSRTDRPRRHL